MSVLQTAGPAYLVWLFKSLQFCRSRTNGLAFLPDSSLLNINIMDWCTRRQGWEKLPLYLKVKIFVAGDAICGFILCSFCWGWWTIGSRSPWSGQVPLERHSSKLNHFYTRITNALLKWICNSGIKSLLSHSKVSPESYYIFLYKQTFKLCCHWSPVSFSVVSSLNHLPPAFSSVVWKPFLSLGYCVVSFYKAYCPLLVSIQWYSL